jgi:hypothetical protein
VTARGRIGVLTSFADVAKGGKGAERLVAKVDAIADAGVPVVWDSGAFSVWRVGAAVDVDSHAAWVAERQAAGRPTRHVGLDVIYDPDGSLANYRRQLAAGARVEPTVHYGEPLSLVDQYLATDPEWINVGGVAQRAKGQSLRQAIGFLAAVTQRAGADVRVHALGGTHPTIGRMLPFDACDSTYWMSVFLYKNLPLFDPDRGDWRKFKFGSKHPDLRAGGWEKMYAEGGWLRSEYGVDPDDLAHAEITRTYDDLTCRLSIESHRRFADWLAERHDRDVVVYLAGGHLIPLHALLGEEAPE